MKTVKNTPRHVKNLLPLVIMLLAWVGTNAQYVITYISGTTTHFLADTNNDNTVDDVTTFDPNTCIWTTTQYSGDIYYYYNNGKYISVGNNSVTFRNSTNAECRIRTNDDNNLYRRYTDYYIRYNNNGWTASNNNNNRAVRYTVNSETQEAETTNYNPTISVAMNSENTGLQFSHGTFTQRIVPSYTDYTIGGTTYLNNTPTTNYYLYNNTFYTSTDSFIPAEASEPDGTSYTWSVTAGGTYASITNDGLLTLNAGVVNSTQTVTVTLTIANSTYLSSPRTVTYDLTLQPVAASSTVTYSEMELSPSSATLDGENTTVTFTASNTLTKTTNNLQASTAFELEGTTYYYNGTASSAFTTTQPVLSTTTESVSYTSFSWSFSGGSGNYYTPSTYYSENTNQLTLTRTSTLTAEDKTYTITLTGRYDGWSGSLQTATATLTIPKTRVNPTALHTLNRSILVGETIPLTYTFEPNYDAAGETYLNIQYSVLSGEQYVSVSNGGTVTGLAEGQAEVKLQAINLDGTNGVYTTAIITVSAGNGTAAAPFVIANASDLAEIATKGLDKYYIVSTDFDASGYSATLTGFSGSLDGNFHTISGLGRAIFNTITGGTVKNVILDDVTITSGTNVGAIANTASGATRIYNCGVLDTTSAIGGTGNVGSIVGQISGNTRVVNCFSYADITSGNRVGGIVGNNNGTSVTSTTVFGTTGTLVMNCAYFGEIASSCSNKYPVFGGNDINNVSGVNTYNYYIYNTSTNYTGPNSAQGSEDKMYFNRFDFYRGLLNSHRDLAAMYIFGTQDVSDAQKNEIAHWLFNPETKATIPYLQLEPWPTNTTSTLSRTIPSTEEAYHGKQVGSVSCTFIIDGTSRTVTLPLTDMDTANWDFTYGKIVLPFANEFGGWSMPASGSTAYDNIITGWEVTSITGGTLGTYSNYNLCDPHHYAKDLYANNNYVFAQGGNFIVPQGVTGITFTAHIVRCVYLRDAYPDIAYDGDYNSATNLGSQLTGTYNGKTVYTNLTNAYAQLQNKTNPADQAIVLVGNFHYNQEVSITPYRAANEGNTTASAKGATIMSVDADNNQDPDFCFLQYHSIAAGRTSIPPLRFDFVVSPGIGMASYTKAGYTPSIGIYHSTGWFETTETYTGIMTETEIRPANMAAGSPWIINGGIFDIIIQGSRSGYSNSGLGNGNLAYFKIGGNAYVKEFLPGHKKTFTGSTLHIKPVNICGGEILTCSLTGYDNTNNTTNSAFLYANGGYIHEYTSAYQSSINGNVTIQADHILCDNFYGGGANDAISGQISGNIDITVNNSYIKTFCGGPKFGSMNSNTRVRVTDTATVFDHYYGGGYGGTALLLALMQENSPVFDGNTDVTFGLPWTHYTGERLVCNNNAITVGYRLQFFIYAGGAHKGVMGFSNYRASLSLATTDSVSSTLVDCTVNYDYYGGGCRGMVTRGTHSYLEGCIIGGSAFGGGYTSAATTCDVYPATQPTYSVFKSQYGLFTKFGTVTPETYSWQHRNTCGVDQTNKILYTTQDMTQMGRVTANTFITVKDTEVGGHLFGGGNSSTVGRNTTVNVFGSSYIHNNVYGGGNQADVGGNTKVTIGECE